MHCCAGTKASCAQGIFTWHQSKVLHLWCLEDSSTSNVRFGLHRIVGAVRQETVCGIVAWVKRELSVQRVRHIRDVKRLSAQGALLVFVCAL